MSRWAADRTDPPPIRIPARHPTDEAGLSGPYRVKDAMRIAARPGVPDCPPNYEASDNG